MAKSALEAIGPKGQNIRKYYQRRLPSDPSKDYYFIHRETGNTQPILVEYGFLDSPDDDVQQLKNDNLEYVEAVVQALANYAGYTYIPPLGSNVYIVEPGDSLYSIANKNNITVDELIAVNNLTNNILSVGQVLTIPKAEKITPSEYEIYTVKKGDSLWSIANNFGVTTDSIIELNNLGTTLLQINQQLLIPKKEVDKSNLYVVQKGDSLYSIGLKYGLTVDELKKANNLSSNNLSIGQELYIPGLETEEQLPEETPNEITYVVQKGDSLWSIAKKYGINVNELKEYNNLTNNTLSINQKLLIPQTENYITYTVKSGDNLYDLANEYNTTVDAIKTLNSLSSNLLSIGQVLLIPS